MNLPVDLLKAVINMCKPVVGVMIEDMLSFVIPKTDFTSLLWHFVTAAIEIILPLLLFLPPPSLFL